MGSNGIPSHMEQAQCILESQTLVYRAMAMAVQQAMHIDCGILAGLNILRDATHVVQDLSKFIVGAHHVGVLNAKEADALLSPILDHSRVWARHMKKFEIGIASTKRSSTSKGQKNLIETSLELHMERACSNIRSSGSACGRGAATISTKAESCEDLLLY